MKPAPKMTLSPELAESTSPMTKLLMEQENLNQPRLIPWVEVYPIKLNYTVVDSNGLDGSNSIGFVLASRRSRAFDVLQGLMKVATPQKSSLCRRVWTKRENTGTKLSGDGYELIDLDALDGKLFKRDKEKEKSSTPQLKMVDLIKRHGDADTVKELEVLVEVRRLDSEWPRESLRFENRIQVGDFVDAQDSAGKWYEALVREVTDDTVKVHYFGWASKWNATVRRRNETEVANLNLVSSSAYGKIRLVRCCVD